MLVPGHTRGAPGGNVARAPFAVTSATLNRITAKIAKAAAKDAKNAAHRSLNLIGQAVVLCGLCEPLACFAVPSATLHYRKDRKDRRKGRQGKPPRWELPGSYARTLWLVEENHQQTPV